MSEKAIQNRNRIIDIANQLFYFRGFNQTSFTDIAEESAIPRGNFYYYFKSKDEILAAVIDKRLADIRNQLSSWDKECPSAQECILKFIKMIQKEAGMLIKFGCPMGSLNVELGKAQPELRQLARQMFDLYKMWLSSKFDTFTTDKEAKDLAIQLLIRAQGVAVLAHTYEDRKLIKQETERMTDWVRSLSTFSDAAIS